MKPFLILLAALLSGCDKSQYGHGGAVQVSDTGSTLAFLALGIAVVMSMGSALAKEARRK